MAYKDSDPEKKSHPELDNCSDEFERIQSLVDRSEKLGVQIRYAIFSSEGFVAGQNTKEPVFAASIGKLPLACAVVELLSPETKILVTKDFIDAAGGGRLDTPTEDSLVAVGELLDDMLRNSGNTAYRVLAHYLGGPDALRIYYEQHWEDTTIHSAPNGRALIGESTAEEAYNQLHILINATSGNLLLRGIAAEALQNNTVTSHGIRQSVSPTDTLRVFNKTGEYNGDTEDPHNYRHDVGMVVGPEGTLGYAIMTTSSKKSHGYIADIAVAQFGAEIARNVGGRDTTSLASRAITLAYRW